MENFVKLLEEESESINVSLKKIEEEVDNLYYRRSSRDEGTHTALRILEEISNTGTALNEMLEQVERENSYLTKKTEETRADLKAMEDLASDIEQSLGDNGENTNLELSGLVSSNLANSSLVSENSLPSSTMKYKIEDCDYKEQEEEESQKLSRSLEKLQEEVQNLYEEESTENEGMQFDE